MWQWCCEDLPECLWVNDLCMRKQDLTTQACLRFLKLKVEVEYGRSCSRLFLQHSQINLFLAFCRSPPFGWLISGLFSSSAALKDCCCVSPLSLHSNTLHGQTSSPGWLHGSVSNFLPFPVLRNKRFTSSTNTNPQRKLIFYLLPSGSPPNSLAHVCIYKI